MVTVSSSGYEPATYHSGNGTAYFVFLYTVQPGDQTSDLEYWDTDALKTDGFVRRDADEVGLSGGNLVMLGCFSENQYVTVLGE